MVQCQHHAYGGLWMAGFKTLGRCRLCDSSRCAVLFMGLCRAAADKFCFFLYFMNEINTADPVGHGWSPHKNTPQQMHLSTVYRNLPESSFRVSEDIADSRRNN